MDNKALKRDEAYDVARREFYALRQQEDVERRIAAEEARMVGGFFGKSAMRIGMELEGKEFERWKAWAAQEIGRIQAERSQAYTSFGDDAKEDADELDDGQERQTSQAAR
jgi:small subunit ribosomal protein S23